MYAVRLTPEADGKGYVVTVPDLPEAITQGETREEALEEAADCLEEAVANRMALKLEIPVPRAVRAGEVAVGVPAETAVKAAFYTTIQELRLSKVELAARLGVDEKEVRRLLDPHHPSKLNRIDQLLRKLGRRLVVGVRAGAGVVDADGGKPRKLPRRVAQAKPEAGGPNPPKTPHPARARLR
jgi:antitoxin HicB